MAESLQNLLIEQAQTILSIQRALVNFKKMSKASITLPTVKRRLQSLDDLRETSRSLHLRIVQMTTPEEQETLPYFTSEEYLRAEDTYDEAADLMSEAIGKLCKPQISVADRSSDSSYRDAYAAHPVQLPRISIPKFAGKFTEWENFRGIFESLIAANDALTNTQKLHYLKTSVTGDAARLIGNFQITDENYTAAWQLLSDEYDNKYAIIQAHIREFADLAPMRSENVTELKRLRDTVVASLAALRGLGCAVETWDDLLTYIITQKFSTRTRNEWNLKRGELGSHPTYQDLSEFLTIRTRGLLECPALPEASIPSAQVRNVKARGSVNHVVSSKCVMCPEAHPLYKCKVFAKQSIDNRYNVVKSNRLCHNCFKSGHYTPACPSKSRCSHCQRPHHSLLHRDYATPSDSQNASGPADSTIAPVAGGLAAGVAPAVMQSVQSQMCAPRPILLATAWVNVHTCEGRTVRVRALLDQGSTFSFISESLCQTLRTRRQRTHLPIRCFGDKFTGAARSRVPLSLSSCLAPGSTFPLLAYVYQKITAYAASQTQSVESWPHLRGLALADPDPSSRDPIHLLIGADLYGSLLQSDLRQGPLGTPTAQLTVFGWVLSGPAGTWPSLSASAQVNTCATTEDLHSLLQRFWSAEEVPSSSPPLTDDEQKCEEHFASSYTRTPQGRYVVRLPFKEAPPPSIGTSFPIALKLYTKLEQRLSRNSDLSQAYHEFLKEYQTLSHMERVSETVPPPHRAVYIPHHAVTREDSSTTKLRVVFNASCRTSNGTTLNEHLFVGPKLQQDLAAIMLRWRQFQFVYTADAAKMYRQILVHLDDVNYQRILWRPPGAHDIQHYRLLTVTYGTACAPYLALKVLQQLATDDGHLFPKAVPIVRDSIYVDDALFGADETTQLIELREQLVSLLERGQFTLRKWTANARELLDHIPPDQKAISDLNFAKDDSLKVLGLSWLPLEDAFKFKVSCYTAAATKRSVLAFTAKLYDPHGWAAPAIIPAKILMQELWLANVGWDDPLPDALRDRWVKYYTDLPNLEHVRVLRWTGVHHTNSDVALHGFADASVRAYAAVAYLRIVCPDGTVRVSLLASKTKVAPISTVSIPRLELNAVVLLSRLLKWIQDSLNLSHASVHGWTDSTVTLAWLNQHPSKWRTYVANRVSAVQTRCTSARWGHVPSTDNPADCASRGLSASELVNFDLWWRGPAWLSCSSDCWPQPSMPPRTALNVALTEVKGVASHHVTSAPAWDLPDRFSSWTTLIRVTAYVKRFVQRARARSPTGFSMTLSVIELRAAETFWLSLIQRTCLASEWRSLHEQRPLPRSSCLLKLNPFVGPDGLIRLGGRLENAPLAYDERHPIILPNHRIVRLLIDRAHKATLHGGTQLTMRLLRQRFWLLSARSLIKSYVRQCITCTRQRAQVSAQQMGNLPSSRVTPSAPFMSTGVDYAGPFNLLASVARGQRTSKHYVALFICLATKAIHLECVDDYSTAGFLAAFRRFVSRRGLPAHVYSDNGTNFQGADRELSGALRSLTRDATVQGLLANDGITWHFIPPAAPHFGGLWEAGVKSLKFHLTRVIGKHTLSRAEFATLLCQVEACLNSRPISALSADPTDLAALTPGHFLIGRPLVCAPEPSVTDEKLNRLSRWQLISRMQEQIWRRWSHDYLHSLQQRHKWSEPKSNLQVNDLVLLKSNLLPPTKWDLARITEVHPGHDRLTRVVTVRTATSTFTRPVTQVCRLPIPFDTGSAP